MARTITVSLGDELGEHVRRRVNTDATLSDEADYIRMLVRRDIEGATYLSHWLEEQFSEPLDASEAEYLSVSAEDVISRNTKR